MMGPATAERRDVESVISQDRVHEWQICNVIFRLVFLDRSDATAFAKVCDGLVEVLIIFFPEDPFEFLAMVAGTGFEIFIAVEDVENLEFHAGEATGHEKVCALIQYIGKS